MNNLKQITEGCSKGTDYTKLTLFDRDNQEITEEKEEYYSNNISITKEFYSQNKMMMMMKITF